MSYEELELEELELLEELLWLSDADLILPTT